MDHLQKYVSQVRNQLLLLLVINNILVIGVWWLVGYQLQANDLILFCSLVVTVTFALGLLPILLAKPITKPTKVIWQAIMHIAPDTANVPSPDLKDVGLGYEMVTNLVSHVYQLAAVVDDIEKTAAKNPHNLHANFVANSLPLPLMVLDKNQNILFANKPMCDYIKLEENEVIGQNDYSVVDMSFSTDNTFDKWLKNAQTNAPVASTSWERVRLTPQNGDGSHLQFDLAAYYNRSNPDGFETMLVFFDHTASYSQDDQALGFVALAVHELRTPVTLLRGYVEVLQDELAGQVSPELDGFMHKMKAAAQSLTAFINNMLDVARIENNQLELKLHEEKWPDIVQTVVGDLSLRAQLQGVVINAQVDPNLPTVGVDRVSIYEVLVNLIDNAVKYSGTSKKVVIRSQLNQEGLVETTVQDFGAGIPTSLLPSLFEKFYRSHRSRNKVGGTGLGLYLCKAMVDAHGGHIWVKSKEGEGSTFGFTVLPYSKVAEEKKNGAAQDITHSAHGWIKNHSLYSH